MGEREEVDMDQLEDLSLAELKRLKEKIKGKKGLNDDLEPVRPDSPQEVEDGEVLSEDEEGQKEEDGWRPPCNELEARNKCFGSKMFIFGSKSIT